MAEWSKNRNVGSLLQAGHFVLGTTNCYRDVLEFENSDLGSEERGRQHLQKSLNRSWGIGNFFVLILVAYVSTAEKKTPGKWTYWKLVLFGHKLILAIFFIVGFILFGVFPEASSSCCWKFSDLLQWKSHQASEAGSSKGWLRWLSQLCEQSQAEECLLQKETSAKISCCAFRRPAGLKSWSYLLKVHSDLHSPLQASMKTCKPIIKFILQFLISVFV